MKIYHIGYEIHIKARNHTSSGIKLLKQPSIFEVSSLKYATKVVT